MNLDLRDPDCKLYVCCTAVSVAAILATAVASLAYLIAAAPSEAYILTSKEESMGVTFPMICAIAFLACLALIVRDLFKRLKGRPAEERDRRFMRAPLSKAGILFAITAFTSMLVILISDLIGEGITESFTDDMTNYELMVSMLCAGPEEEFICRMLLIGLLVTLLCMAAGHKGSLKNFFGGFGMSRAALVLLIISSVIFGLLHLDGWSIMKFPDTFISGVLFGYVYIQYGVHASIVMHSTFDLMACFDVFLDGAGTVPIIALAVLGAALTLRSLLKIRSYIPENNLNEPFEGSLMEMWERERRSQPPLPRPCA